MGGTGWNYVTAWRGDIAASFAALQQEVFESRNFYPVSDYPEEHYATLDDVWQDESLRESETHSILDIRTVLDPDEHPVWPTKSTSFPERCEYFGTLRPLPLPMVVEVFGTKRPTREDYERLRREEDLTDRFHIRHTGVCVTLWSDGVPAEVAFWGSSGMW
jgi:hypothetical protein